MAGPIRALEAFKGPRSNITLSQVLLMMGSWRERKRRREGGRERKRDENAKRPYLDSMLKGHQMAFLFPCYAPSSDDKPRTVSALHLFHSVLPHFYPCLASCLPLLHLYQCVCSTFQLFLPPPTHPAPVPCYYHNLVSNPPVSTTASNLPSFLPSCFFPPLCVSATASFLPLTRILYRDLAVT